MLVTPELVSRLSPKLHPAFAELYAANLQEALRYAGIDENETQAALFLAQTAHESMGYTRFEENLNYSAGALLRVWPNRFKTLEEAKAFHRQPEKIANRVYGGRMGNGPEESGDGWLYRGRGAIQITGREMYRAIGKMVGLDFEAIPDQVSKPYTAFLSAAAYWRYRDLKNYNSVLTSTKRINGGTVGLEDRERLFQIAFA